MQFERTLMKVGGSVAVVIPTDLLKYIGLEEGDSIVMTDDDGKHGKFISFWKKKV